MVTVPPDPTSRLRHVLAIEQLDAPPGSPLLLETDSNDVWKIGDIFVRVCWRGDRARLERERLVAIHLPEGIPYPTIVSGGQDEALSWTVTRALAGAALSDQWDRLPIDERRAAIRQHAQVLETLHAWRPPPRVADALRQRPPIDPSDPATTIVGADVNPLPLSRAMLLVQAAKQHPFVDRGVVDAVAAIFHELRARDPFLADDLVVVHGDAAPTNVLWHNGRLVALLDFEWVRWGPRDLELAPFIGFMGGRSLLLAWLEEDYPRLFAHPAIIERLWLYDLAGALRGLIVWPPRSPEDQQRPYSALWHLRRAIEGPAYQRTPRSLTTKPVEPRHQPDDRWEMAVVPGRRRRSRPADWQRLANAWALRRWRGLLYRVRDVYRAAGVRPCLGRWLHRVPTRRSITDPQRNWSTARSAAAPTSWGSSSGDAALPGLARDAAA